jgi:hypothetical protein
MPQAPRILSKSQILALESCYLFFRTLPALLQSIGNEVRPSTREQLQEQAKLAVMNRARLMAAFPEVAEAAKRWGGQ